MPAADPFSMVFISEPIQPEPCTFNAAVLATGLTSPPRAFHWRGRRFEVTAILESRKVSGPEVGRSDGERYLRRQEFVVQLGLDAVGTLYFQRTGSATRSRRSPRWFLLEISAGAMSDKSPAVG